MEFDQRGGARKKKKLKTSQQLLIDAIWHIHGGTQAVAEKLGVHRQLPQNWRLRGYVPLEWVGAVSRTLNVPKEALNYEGVVGLLGKGREWEDIVIKDFSFLDSTYILKGEFPRSVKEILE